MGYIKRITIQGFKSYKDQTGIEDFSPKSNIVVGRNGSGKSNFFAAVRFVLGDDYQNLVREERQALLHEGSGSAVMSAFVEVCFDNTEDRFQTGKPEFYLRRTIGAKKDEYSVNRKSTTKTDVMQILESAGFSRSNPYYIVPQGRVTAITNMKDPERLKMLKEISGSNVYETRRADSEKLMRDTEHKCDQIDNVVRSINERLSELEVEKEELERWSKNDRERRCLIYTMKQREEEQLEAEIENIDNLRHNGVAGNDNNRALFVQNEKEMARIDNEIRELKAELELLKDERAQSEAERMEYTLEQAKLELEVKELTDGQSAAQQARRRRDAELKTIQQQIRNREAELEKLLPQYTIKKEEEATVRSQLLEAESQRKRLEDKQGRTAFYSNKRQRDDALRAQINDINTDLTTMKANLMQTNEEVSSLQNDIAHLESEITNLKSNIENEGDNTLNLAAQVEKAKDNRKALYDKQTELFRENNRIDSQISNANAQYQAAQRSFSHMLPHNTSKGLETLNRLKQRHNLSGVYGTIGELLEVSDTYKQVTEVSAGAALWHVVCDNDATASRLIELLIKERGGQLTCIPLNQVSPKDVRLPQKSDMQPLLPKLRYDSAYENAFKQVFGKVVVCPDLQTCKTNAAAYHVNAFTADGDRADNRGRYQGGWRDPTQSQLDAVRNVTSLREQVEQLRERKAQINHELDTIRQQLTAAASEVRKMDYERNQVENSYGPMRQELRAKQLELQNKKTALESKQQTATRLQSKQSELSARQQDLQDEIVSEFKKALSRDEEQMLVSLAASVQDLRRQSYRLTEERTELESRKAEIEVELLENLQPTLDQLLTQQNGAGGSANQPARLKECERQLKNISDTVTSFDEKILEVDNQIDEANSQLGQLETSRSGKEKSNREIAVHIEKQQKRMDRSMQDRASRKDQLIAVQRDIRELGTLPEDHQKYADWNIKKVSDRLTKVNEAQKKFSHVNKKAFEQYENFTKQRKTLTDRRAELDASRQSIEDLIYTLDQRKDEAIDRTFKQVSKAFREVFAQLVPAGRGSLIIQRKSDREARRAHDNESDEEDGVSTNGAKTGVENYSGVGIAVSFNSKHDEQQRISQLSGGQKSLCALALIFAIQQCDPAPFYLFDEIDANLDAQYRTAVAEMLKKLSGKGGESGEGGGQFICTTFRPEMVLVADKCYGVSYSNKTSSIDVVTRDEALKFVESVGKT